ncbi:MAG: hypothetical protein II625_08480 [Bacilli bacterium]|nr:hypothetical protein [Bacilli bacterium]
MTKKKEIKVELEYTKENLKKFNIVGSSFFRWSILLLLVMYTVFQILFLVNGKIEMTLIIVSLFLIAICYFYDYYLFNLTYKRTKINNNNEELKLILRFSDNQIISQRIDDKNEYTYPYSIVRKIIETKEMLIVLLQYRLGFPIMKYNTSSEEIESIKKKVLEKNPHVKLRKYHPYKSWVLLIFVAINAIFLGIFFALK